MSNETPTARWSIGDVEIVKVTEGIHGVPAEALIPDITPAHLEQHASWVAPYFTESGKILLSVHSFVVLAPDATIVVDTCVGNHAERPLPTDDSFPDRLASVIPGGLDAVDVVVCTHVHFDHVGWNTIERNGVLVPTFSNARYLISRREFDFLETEDHGTVRDVSTLPLVEAGVLDPVESDHAICDEVRLVPTPGHAPGHVSVAISSAGKAGFITGDAIHTPLQIPHPELSATHFDWDSEMAISTRHELIAHLADDPTLVLGTHFADPTAGHVTGDVDGTGPSWRAAD